MRKGEKYFLFLAVETEVLDMWHQLHIVRPCPLAAWHGIHSCRATRVRPPFGWKAMLMLIRLPILLQRNILQRTQISEMSSTEIEIQTAAVEEGRAGKGTWP